MMVDHRLWFSTNPVICGGQPVIVGTRVLIAAAGHDVDTVKDAGIEGCFDAVVWRAATTEARFLITRDLDCSAARRCPPGHQPGIRLRRLSNPGGEALTSAVASVLAEQPALGGRFCVLSDHKGTSRNRSERVDGEAPGAQEAERTACP